MIKKTSTWFLTALLILTIGFGILKQFKAAWRSAGQMRADHRDAGSSIRRLVERLEADRLKKVKIVYTTDRLDRPGLRPGNQYIYDAQYALAPLVLVRLEADADHVLFDGEGPDSVARFSEARSDLELLGQEENAALFRVRGAHV